MKYKYDYIQRALLRPIQPELGFTMAEVVISLMIGSIALVMLMQNVLTAAGFQARSEQYDKAITWIQEDLESVKYQANEYQKNVNPYSPLCSATNPATGFAASFMNDATIGLGGSIKTFDPRLLGGKSLVMKRTVTYATSADPYKLLQIVYSVTPAGSSTEVASLTTEVIPYASLKCP